MTDLIPVSLAVLTFVLQSTLARNLEIEPPYIIMIVSSIFVFVVVDSIRINSGDQFRR